MYQQAIIQVEDQQTFAVVKSAIDQAFSSAGAPGFLKSLEKSKLHVRDFEDVLKAGKLGPQSAAAYAKLGNGDQGMIREFYLSSLEKVSPELRAKYLKVYAYY